MSLLDLLNALLVLVVPFLIVAPMALVAMRNLAPASRWRAPAVRFPSIRLEVAL